MGIAKGTFYYYFKSKEDILDALVHEMVSQLSDEYKIIADDPKMSVMDKMRQMLRGQSYLQKRKAIAGKPAST